MNRFTVTDLTIADCQILCAKYDFSRSPISHIPHMEMLMKYGIQKAINLDGKIVGACGVGVMFRGVGEVWAAYSKDLLKYKYSLFKITRILVNTTNVDFHRIQATVPVLNVKSAKWLESLGFTSEGIMVKYSADKQDHYLLSKIWP